MRDQKDEIEVDSLSVALTKPPMKMGVPLIVFFGNIVTCFFAWMLYRSLFNDQGFLNCIVFFLIWCITHSVMYLITKKDKFGLNILWVNILHFRKTPNTTFWGNTDSYLP